MQRRKTLKESDFKRIHKKLGCRGCIFAAVETLDTGPCCSYPGQIVPTKEGCPKRCERVQPLAVPHAQVAPNHKPEQMTAATGRR